MLWQEIGDTSTDEAEEGSKRHHFSTGECASDSHGRAIH